jgi:hypothetical protein
MPIVNFWPSAAAEAAAEDAGAAEEAAAEDAEEPPQAVSSQKRTTSDFTHNVSLLYLFACAAYRYRTGKLCFVCKARTVSLYTREVYHTFHGKTTHFCPKTAFIIDCIKYIDRLF